MSKFRAVATLGCCVAVVFSESVRSWCVGVVMALSQAAAERRTQPIIDALTATLGG